MTNRQRLSASVDADLIVAGKAAVADGKAENLSAWVNDALRRQTDHDRRMRALGEFIEFYEAEHGVITNEEIAEVTREMRSKAIVVRPTTKALGRGTTTRKRGAA